MYQIKNRLKKIAKAILYRNNKPVNPNLDGDRNIEWSWVIKYLPHGKKVLDIGCCYSMISSVAARFDNFVIGSDLNDEINYRFDNFKLVQGDFNTSSFDNNKFDCIVLASTVEHMGLSGRYNSPEDSDGDLKTMRRVKALLAQDGEVLLTIPVGIDGVFKPYHRIYGVKRLSQLLEGFDILEDEFWFKSDKFNWIKVGREKALQESGSEIYYALGLFKLKLKK